MQSVTVKVVNGKVVHRKVVHKCSSCFLSFQNDPEEDKWRWHDCLLLELIQYVCQKINIFFFNKEML